MLTGEDPLPDDNEKARWVMISSLPTGGAMGTDETVQPATIECSVTISTPQIMMKHHYWTDWAEIAIRGSEDAAQAHQRILTAASAGEALPPLAEELQPAMIAIVSASSAIDAVYGVIRRNVSLPALSDTAARHDHIRAALNSGYKIENGRAKHWNKECTWLFGLRDPSLHPDELFMKPVPHATGSHTAPEFVNYSAVNAARAVELMLEILDVFTTETLARTDGLAAYARDLQTSYLGVEAAAKASRP